MNKEKLNESLYERLVNYGNKDYYPFHMPGHKRNTDIISMVNPYKIDITEIDDFDNLHNANDVIGVLMKRISIMYESKSSYILVNGSTCGILAAISAVLNSGDEIAIGRNCHKSVYNAVYINKLSCNYIVPKVNSMGMFNDISLDDIKRSFEEKPDIKAVVITSPTYEGIVSDIEEISEYVHKKGAVLIVDEAHGAHLKFNSYFPNSAVDMGADIVIESIHKTLPAFTQTSLLHICSDRVDVKRVEKFLSIYESSSPSYILMSSVEKCIDIVQKCGKDLFERYIGRLKKIYGLCENMECISVFKPRDVYAFDQGKINIISNIKEYTGKDLYDELLYKYHLQMEMASERYVIAMTSICDTDEGIDRLIFALKEIDSRLKGSYKSVGKREKVSALLESEAYTIPKKVYEAYETDMLKAYEASLDESVGKISGAYVYLYPPGCPLLVPGEIITECMIENIRRYMSEGLNVTGINNKKIIVVNNDEIK